MKKNTNEKNRFVVDLGDLDLKDDQRHRINASIQKAVSGELATIDTISLKRSVLIPVNPTFKFPILWGIVFRDYDKVIIKDSVTTQ